MVKKNVIKKWINKYLQYFHFFHLTFITVSQSPVLSLIRAPFFSLQRLLNMLYRSTKVNVCVCVCVCVCEWSLSPPPRLPASFLLSSVSLLPSLMFVPRLIPLYRARSRHASGFTEYQKDQESHEMHRAWKRPAHLTEVFKSGHWRINEFNCAPVTFFISHSLHIFTPFSVLLLPFSILHNDLAWLGSRGKIDTNCHMRPLEMIG